MTYTTDTTIKGPSRGSATAFYGYAVSKGSARLPDVKLYLETLEKLCRSNGLRYEVLVAQSAHETSDGNAPWVSFWWKQRLNPAGVGITGDGIQNNASRTFADGAAAARAHFLHMWLYVSGTSIPTGLSKDDDPRYSAAVNAGYAGIADTISDLTNRWGVDNAYADGIVKWLNRFETIGLLGEVSGGVEIPGKEPDMAQYSTAIPGLPGGPLLTDYPINIKLIPASRTYQRPGIKASKPRRSVQHGTGNPNSMAASEASWLVDQQAGGGQVSFHSTSDDTGVWVCVPADEVTWQAADGDGPGNMNGFSCEMIENEVMWGNTSRKNRAIYVTADWMGRVAARLDIAIPEQHYTFNYNNAPSARHDCPYKLRHVSGAWDAYVKQWNASKADELVRMGKPVPTPEPEKPATPSDIGFQKDLGKKPYYTDDSTYWFNGTGRYVAAKDTPALKYAVAGSGTIRTIKKGDTVVEVAHGVSKTDGKPYILTAARERVLMDDLTYVAPGEEK